MILGGAVFLAGRHYGKGWLMWIGGIYAAVSLVQVLNVLHTPGAEGSGVAGSPRGLVF